MSRIVEATQRVPASLAGARLDQAAAELFSDYSRERLKAWINAGELTVDGAKVKPKAKLHGHEVQFGSRLGRQSGWQRKKRASSSSLQTSLNHRKATMAISRNGRIGRS